MHADASTVKESMCCRIRVDQVYLKPEGKHVLVQKWKLMFNLYSVIHYSTILSFYYHTLKLLCDIAICLKFDDTCN